MRHYVAWDPSGRYLPELGESELGSPDFTLAAETVGTDQLEPVTNAQNDG